MQMALTKFVKPKKKIVVVYRFLQDLPEILGPNGVSYGPFKKGDLVGVKEIPREIWKVLEERKIVEPYKIRW